MNSSLQPEQGSSGRQAGGKRAFVVVCNSLPPYRTHLLQRVVREIPELQLWTVCTHENTPDRWAFTPPEEINPVLFGPGQPSRQQGKRRYMFREWRKGGRIIEWLKQRPVGAVLVEGYNDAGRVRLIHWLHRHGIAVFLFGDSNIRGDRARGIKVLVKRLLLRPIFRRCSAVLPCGRLGREYFIKYGADPDRIFFYPCEPDYALIDSIGQPAIDAVREAYGLDPARRRLVYSGRLVPVKRVDLLIDAFSRVADDRPEWDLVIAGDGPLRAELEARVPEALRHRVKFLGFINDQARLTAVYKACDVLVLPSSYEPWALVINEAARAGLAIVASNVVGAAYELVRDGENGRLVAPDDLRSLVEALREITDPANIDRMKAASPDVLARWRASADPIAGLRRALADAGVLSQ